MIPRCRIIVINSLEMDRQTGILYAGTTKGIYFLDRSTETWIKMSKNVPFYAPKFDILDCKGTLYAGVNRRGVWKSELVRNSSTPTLKWEITETQTWDHRMNLYSTLVIKPGVTLTITDELVVFGNQKIIVEPGGKLIVDGGTITSQCNDFWEGIEVWGNSTALQSMQNQGTVITKNNAVIENAKTAIRLIAKDENGVFDWSKTGGIIYASNTHFKNNNRSAEFLHYHSFIGQNNQYEVRNHSRFTECQFTWDDDYLGETLEPAITMFHVYGVKVNWCSFEDSRTNITSVNDRAKGIYTLDAGYRVIAKKPWNAPVHHVFDSSDGYKSNTFKNMQWGVNATNANTQYAVTVDHSHFENVEYPVTLSYVNNSVVTRNLVDVTTDRPQEISQSIGTLIENSTAYTVEGNTYNATDPTALVFGSLAIETGANQNQIFRNFGTGIDIGHASLGRNSNTNAQNYFSIVGQKGLVWRCNEGTNNKFDLYSEAGIPTIDGRGVRAFQGSDDDAAGNKFTDGTSAILNSNIVNTKDQQMSYFYFNDDPAQNPTIVENVATIGIEDEANCNSSFGTTITVNPNVPLIAVNVASELSTELSELTTTIQSEEVVLKGKITDANSQSLLDAIERIDAQSAPNVFAQLENASPYLSDATLREVGKISTNIFPHSWMGALVLQNIEVAKNESFYRFLQTKKEPLKNPWMKQVENARKTEFTARGKKAMRILKMKSRQALIQNQLLSNVVSDSLVNWEDAKARIIERNDILVNVELADLALARGNKAECQQQLHRIKSSLNDFDYFPSVKRELKDYITLKNFILAKADENGVYRGISDKDLPTLVNYANTLSGIAQRQAKNLLCFHRGICDERNFPMGKSSKLFYNEGTNDEMQAISDEIELTVVPNPNQGVFELKLSDNVSIEMIEVFGIDGKIVSFREIQRAGTTVLLELLDQSNSVNFVRVRTEEGLIYTAKIILNK